MKMFPDARTLAGILAVAASVTAQPRLYKPGEMVEVDGGETYKILRCFGQTEWDDCEYQAYWNGKPTGQVSRLSIRNLRASEERLRKSRGGTAPSPASTPVSTPSANAGRPSGTPATPGTTASTPKTPPAGKGCDFQPPGPPVSSRDSFSEGLARRKIYDGYAWRANTSLTAPKRIGVTFLAFQLSESYRNTVTNVPGLGAQRRHAGAPVGATVHTLKSRHIVCEEYADGISRRQVLGTHACFVNAEGSWTCASENDTSITHLDRDE